MMVVVMRMAEMMGMATLPSTPPAPPLPPALFKGVELVLTTPRGAKGCPLLSNVAT